MKARCKLFWAIWFLIVVGVIWWFATLCANGSDIWIKPPYVFAATAADESGRESDFSNEAWFTNRFPKGKSSVILAWDPPPSTNRITHYFIYQGRFSGVYTNCYDAGTNLLLEVPLSGPAKTNLIITVSATNLDHLMYSDTVKGPWYSMLTNYWRVTNPVAPRMFRAYGTNQGKIKINAIHE